MGKKTVRNSKNNRYAKNLQDHKLDKVKARKSSTGKTYLIPSLSTLLCAILAAAVAWVQAQSKDLLPKYIMGPAIIGAVFAGFTAVLSIFGFFQLKKGDGYHDKHEESFRASLQRGNKPEKLSHQSHPFYMYHWILFGDAIAMMLTTGSYLYMVGCLIVGTNEYCVAIATATSQDDCKVKGNNGVVTVLLLGVLTIATGVLLFYYDKLVKDHFDYFDYRHQRLGKLAELDRTDQTGMTKQRLRSSVDRDQYQSRNDEQPPGYSDFGEETQSTVGPSDDDDQDLDSSGRRRRGGW